MKHYGAHYPISCLDEDGSKNTHPLSSEYKSPSQQDFPLALLLCGTVDDPRAGSLGLDLKVWNHFDKHLPRTVENQFG